METSVLDKPPVIDPRQERRVAHARNREQQAKIIIPPQFRELSIVEEVKSRGKLPSGFERVRMSELPLTLTPKDLPWLGQASLKKALAEITLAGKDENGEEQMFLFGSAILGKDLIGAADQLDEHRSRIANNLLYTQLTEFIREGHAPRIKPVYDAVTEGTIYNAFNPGGQRVYFIFKKLQGIPTIVRIAACDKDRQGQVLKVLTTQSHKAIKQAGGL